MKPLTKTLTAAAAILLIAGCTAIAADTPTETQATPQGWYPGWRHEQMIKARQDGTLQPGFGPGMMGRRGGFGPGMGFGPGATADPASLPPWCPYRTQAPAPTK